MAFTSFTIRRVDLGGDYLQYVPGSGGASVSGASSLTYLRGDGVQEAPILSDEVGVGGLLTKASFFEATPFDYGIVDVSWGLTLYDVSATEVRPYEVVLCYSPDGCPETIGEGFVLLETRTQNTYRHFQAQSPWSYYTLFVRFKGGLSNSDYYEPVAKLTVLVPNNLGSTDDLYSKIPEVYRYQDESGNGDLYKYLSIFGWDIDRARTLIDFLMAMKDPRVANGETLDAISSDLGLNLLSEELGPSRLRGYIDNIGTIRKEKGTYAGTIKAIQAIAGSTAEVSGSKIDIYPHRTNFIKDPRFRRGIGSALDMGSPSSTYSGAFSYDSGYYNTPASAYTIVYDGGGVSASGGEVLITGTEQWTLYDDLEQSNYEILETMYSSSQTSGSPNTYNINVIGGDVFYFSIRSAVENKLPQNSIESVAFYNSGGFSGGSAGIIVKDINPQIVSGTPYWRLEVPSTVTTYTPVVLTIRFDVTKGSVEEFDYALLEKGYIGEYFDGDTIRGGWLVDGNSISDYRWLGTANQSFSVYSANYQKTRNVVYRLLPEILPITNLLTPSFSGSVYSNKAIDPTNYRYSIEFNKIPGV